MDLVLYSKLQNERSFGATDLSNGGQRVHNIMYATCFYLSEQKNAETRLQEIANNNQIYVIFLDYVNREDLIKKLKEYCKELEKDNNLVVDFHFEFPGTATISWHEKVQ